MGRLARPAARLAAAMLLALVLLPGCRSTPKPGKHGVWYTVRAGDNLWQLSQETGVPVETLRGANRIDDVRNLQVGQRLWIPGRDRAAPPTGVGAPAPSWRPRADSLELRPGGDCSDAAREERLDFEWPVLGRVTSAFGADRGSRPHDGIDISAPRGTPVHAAEAGKVVYAGDDLGDYGRIVVVKHAGRWATVYAHNERNAVAEGDFVEKGEAIASVGQTGNASGPHLHFEIRRANRPRDPAICLP